MGGQASEGRDGLGALIGELQQGVDHVQLEKARCYPRSRMEDRKTRVCAEVYLSHVGGDAARCSLTLELLRVTMLSL